MSDFPIEDLLDLVASSAFQRSPRPTTIRSLERLGPKDMSLILSSLAEHRLQFLFWDALCRCERTNILEERARRELAAEFQDALVRHAIFEWELMRTAAALKEHGLAVIACKGAVLARHFYPSRGLRRMHDIDYWLLDPDIKSCAAALQEVGFVERPEKAIPDARSFINSSGTVLDVHVRMRLFEDRGFSLWDLSKERQADAYRVFTPEAMLVHLITHMLGHAHQTGILLCWLLDVALVLRAGPVEVGRMQSLFRDDGSWTVFLRIVRSFQEMGWVEDDCGLQSELRAARGVNWDILMRQRRRSGWAGIRGKLKLGKTLALSRDGHPPFPRPVDLLWQPWDWLREECRLTAGSGAMLIPREE